MHVITRKRIVEFSRHHPDAKSSLDNWFRIVKSKDFTSFSDLRQSFACVDQVGRLTVFNIGGNKYRLIAYVPYLQKRVYIRHILTHDEYSKGKWKDL